MQNSSRGTQQVLVLCLCLAGTAFASGKGNGGSNGRLPPPPIVPPPAGEGNGAASYMQQVDSQGNLVAPGTPFPGGSLEVQKHGAPGSIIGSDHDLNGNLLYVSALPALPADNSQKYVTRTDAAGTFQVLINRNDADPAKGYDVGPRYLATVQNLQTVFQKWLPAEAINALTAQQLEGSNLRSGAQPTDVIGLTVDGAHNDNSWVGGMTNYVADKTEKIEALIANAKQSHDTFIDLSTQIVSGAGFGSPGHPVVVYCEGTTNPDGTVSENGLHWSGLFPGYGILVINVDDPSNGGLIMSGQSGWTGLVVLACNKIGTGTYIDVTGNGGVLGGTLVYNRNNPNPKCPTATMLGMALVTFRGNGSFMFSSQGMIFADMVGPQGMQVRSWRRVPSNQ